MMYLAKFQIGKNGITPGVIDSLLLVFKTHKQVRISMLKSSGRNKDSIEKDALEIINGLESKTENKFNYKIIGFTIILSKYSFGQKKPKNHQK